MMNLLINLLELLVLALCAMDLGLTAKYILAYKKYQPEMPIERIENNFILRTLIKQWGINLGLLIGSILIFLLVLGIVELTN